MVQFYPPFIRSCGHPDKFLPTGDQMAATECGPYRYALRKNGGSRQSELPYRGGKSYWDVHQP